MISSDQIDTLPGADVLDRDGDKVGTVGQVYLSSEGGEPLFVTVKTGLFGLKESFVPLEGASASQGGVRVAYDHDVIKGAPRIDADQEITEDEQSTLFDYYDGRAGGVPADGSRTDRSTTNGVDTDSTSTGTTGSTASDSTSGSTYSDSTTGSTYSDSTTGSTYSDADGVDTTAGTRGAGHDTSGPDTDDAITLSEERVKAGVQRVETGRARLRKHIVTEQQTVTVPVSHDEVRIEREPITDANAGAALDGPDLSEEEHEVVLTEERPVVDTETVPVERVRLATETVTEQQQVTQDVRHEEIETDGVDADRTR